MSDRFPVVIIGAGPAGLTAGYEATRQGATALLLEKAEKVGGIARTETYKGYHFDIGGHRFFTKVAEVQQLWEEMLGDDFRRVPRLSHMVYRGRFFKYPVDALDALSKLGPAEGMRILLSYSRARLRPSRTEDNFEDWVTNRFGRRLYEAFFKTYTEKVWGIPCREIRAEWAAQRIQGLSLTAAIKHALFGQAQAKSLIGQFHYPLRGPGMMWQRFRQSIEERGGQVWMGAEALRLQRDGNRVGAVVVQSEGAIRTVTADAFISSMPLPELINRLDPPPPSDVLQAASRLTYRAFILVGLIVKQADLFPDQWIYIHGPELRVGRVQNFKNWSPAMVPDPATTGLGMEYFCSEGDEIWRLPDTALVELARREAAMLGLAEAGDVVDGAVYRQPAAYPVYDGAYREPLGSIRAFLATLTNLQTIGRNGMHRYNNQDHSMLTAMLAVKNLRGEAHDLWSVNTEQAHHEARPAPQGMERRVAEGER
jgi:protoporphyrinogen oxidase